MLSRYCRERYRGSVVIETADSSIHRATRSCGNGDTNGPNTEYSSQTLVARYSKRTRISGYTIRPLNEFISFHRGSRQFNEVTGIIDTACIVYRATVTCADRNRILYHRCNDEFKDSGQSYIIRHRDNTLYGLYAVRPANETIALVRLCRQRQRSAMNRRINTICIAVISGNRNASHHDVVNGNGEMTVRHEDSSQVDVAINGDSALCIGYAV